MRKNIIVAAFLTVALSAVSFAGRPFLTEDAPTSSRGEFTVEFGADYKDPSGDIDSNVALTYGISDKLEMYVEVPFVMAGNSGNNFKIDNFAVGGKYNLARWSDVSTLSLAAVVDNLPSGDPFGYTVAAVFSRDMGGWTCHSNLGALLSSSGFDSYIWGAGAEIPMSDKLALCMEAHSGSTLFDRAFSDNHVTAMLGMAYTFGENLVFDVSARLPMTDAAKFPDDDGNATEKAHYVAGITYGF